MIRKLVSEGDIQGVHFCTLNLEKSVQRVLEALQWTGVHPHLHNRLIAVSCVLISVLKRKIISHTVKGCT